LGCPDTESGVADGLGDVDPPSEVTASDAPDETVAEDDAEPAMDSADVPIDTPVKPPPDAPVVSIAPESPLTGDKLTAMVAEPPTGALQLRYSWEVDGASATLSQATVPSSETARGQTWQVSVVVVDGDTESPPGAAQVTVGNTPPVCGAATLTPAEPVAADVVTCGCRHLRM